MPACFASSVDCCDTRDAERVDDLLERDAAHDAVGLGLDDFAALDERPRLDAVHRAAVDLVDDDVLGDVHETPLQIARVGGLECRVGQTLAGAACAAPAATRAGVRRDGCAPLRWLSSCRAHHKLSFLRHALIVLTDNDFEPPEPRRELLQSQLTYVGDAA